MTRAMTAVLLLSTTLCDAAEWLPPEDPDPKAILREARADTQAGRYADALAKHVWFHDHALEYRRSLYGVRLSFALADWMKLANEYAPAMEQMRETRDAARRLITAGQGDTYHLFNDFEALNRELGEPQQSIELFLMLRTESPATARRVYRLVEKGLFEAGEYSVCGEYLDPSSTLRSALRIHGSMVEHANKPNRPAWQIELKDRELKFADSSLAEDAARIIVLLVKNGREKEAADVVAEVKPKLSHQEHLDQIDAALSGEFTKAP